MPRRRLPTLLNLLAGLLVGMVVAPVERAAAGTAIGESIWDRNNARDRALQLVPAGAQVQSTDCQSVEVGTGNFRYICRITYSDPAPQPQAPSR
jgi:hypothetical protein